MTVIKKAGYENPKTRNAGETKKILRVKEKRCDKCDFKSDLTLKKYRFWIAEVSDSPTPIGWVYVILKRHAEYFDELTIEELTELKDIIKELRQMLIKAFKPDWFNVMQLGNGGRHIHFHLVPRYNKVVRFDGKDFSDPDYGRMLVDRYKPYDKKVLLKMKDYLERNL
jgi:diadenosine tetraphosphate (Ap4A) HIT family hydrolase